ncbi:uncharacterized protein BX664DRAFT_299846 [Halteromyces radiatus]|uniref:uncharacterized protein n=1 Tax=Halteromyces radiatus TaxID=101107 RepID=UPI00221F2B3D|nr:uncharacterized protein BX664DRAFT_299846 [Halteromyces radiatus]KAI8084512.1 hypothetical protein BX664DRAFT_299846 [Halteromyces radiatus]
MALKLELEQWQNACSAFDSKDYDSALKTFINMADNAKMHFNIGLIFAAVEDHERALAAYSRSITMDPYFAVAYFQKGVSQFCLGNMQEAMQEFDNAHVKLRGNQIINYQQLGLAFRLYACEVLFNRGICRLYLGKIDAGLTDLYHAQKSKMTEEHDVIDQAVRERGKGYSVFSIPVGVLYRPPESRLRQMRGNVDMFDVVDKLGLNKFQKPIMAGQPTPSSGISRNNSVLLSKRPRKDSNPGPYMQSYSSQEDWPDTSSQPSSSTSSFTSSLRYRADGRRVDSGFESSHEDRFSFSSRNSAKSHKTNQDERDRIRGRLNGMTDEEGERRGSEQSGKSISVRPTPSTSTHSRNDNQGSKIKIKVHHIDTRVLLVSSTITFDDLIARVRDKLNAPAHTRLQYKDEDNEMVLMIDDDDLQMARQIHKVRNNNDLGVEKMEIWCIT